MSKKKLIEERISRTEEKELSAKDLELLKTKRNKQILFLLSGFLPFIAIMVYIFMMGADSINTDRNIRIEIDDEKRRSFSTVLPYFAGFVCIMLTIYFGKLYFQSLRPLLQDLKANKKKAIYFIPEKNPMAVFNKYYVSTPLFNQQQIQVSAEDFAAIGDQNEMCLEVGANSLFILRFLSGQKEIKVLNNY